MQARLKIQCNSCGRNLGEIVVDTADMPEELQARINRAILGHRQNCRYYVKVFKQGKNE